MTRSEITKQAIEELTWRGARVRQVHNIPFRRKANNVVKGWPDIQGYSNSAVAILVEVKSENDKLSKEQIERLNDAEKCGAICMIAYFKKGYHLDQWCDYKIKFLINKVK